MIAISTLAFLEQYSVEEIIAVAQDHGWMLEFTSSFPYREGVDLVFRQATVARLPHNYFPPPAAPFVLNLASTDPKIRERSIAHCQQGIRLAAEADSPFYAAHAGFCLDPSPHQLGHPLEIAQSFHRPVHWDLFLNSIRSILATTQSTQVPFLIENNVLASFNLTSKGGNPLLCVDAGEIISLVKAVDDERFGLLLDTAHLKVSSCTLGFDLEAAVRDLQPFVKGIHHSDNDGQTDTNDPLDENYWFAPWIPAFRHLTHVLEVKRRPIVDIQRMIQLLTQWQNE